ncbi:hypothetical protein C943_04264 [Mariniradius saccharolyticus AK6]|uniref:Uncharacterized protein n=1 Tax=Mariniradius saccharolyticus AK6 TaxID=1239962 RepID=M7X975_9BACT|nr:hypothetical protein C943_04264 [Mariniradius saccharolyticus AK6]
MPAMPMSMALAIINSFVFMVFTFYLQSKIVVRMFFPHFPFTVRDWGRNIPY